MVHEVVGRDQPLNHHSSQPEPGQARLRLMNVFPLLHLSS